ncbi:MAG TPA: crosslink repair DNA glycosylase YcaQ family protein [Ornithinibacter sp.]|nr:crosslink repair DNA glycosylase YcaQ family protein [Ornithinibacter sp.]
MVHQLTRQQARRIAVRAQLLDTPRPTGLLQVVRRLWVVQVDLTAAVAPSADLVLWSRLGSAYSPHELDALLVDRAVVEHDGLLHAADDMALFRADMRDWPGRPPLREWQEDTLDWVEANTTCRDDILRRLRADGPLPARDLPDTCDVPWRSSGWNSGKNVLMLLGCMERRGEVAVSSREGRERLWDLAERVLPDDRAVPWQEARIERDRRRLASLGIARARATQTPGEPNSVADAGEPAVVEGVRGAWRVDPEQLEAIGRPFRGRTALLSPLDRLVFDRARMTDLFEFDYQLEMYKPAAARRWGYWAMPVLHGDRLVGKLDATADPEAGLLRVDALHEDEPLSVTTRAAVDREIRSLASLLDLAVERA